MLKIIQKIALILFMTTTSAHAIDWQIARPVFDVSTIIYDEEFKKLDFNSTYFKDDYVEYTILNEGEKDVLILNLADHFERSGYGWYNALENYFGIEYDASDIELRLHHILYMLTIMSGKSIFLYDDSPLLWKLRPTFQMLTFIMYDQANSRDKEKALSFENILRQLKVRFPKLSEIRFYVGEDENKQPIYTTIPAELDLLKTFFLSGHRIKM